MITAYENVWDALCDSPEESQNMSLRSMLMMAITEKIDESGWSVARAAKILDVTPPIIEELYCGKVGRFTVESLLKLARPLGIGLQIEQSASPAMLHAPMWEMRA